MMKSIIEKRLKCSKKKLYDETSDDSDSEMIPASSMKRKDLEISNLRKKCRIMSVENAELRTLNMNLQRALCSRLLTGDSDSNKDAAEHSDNILKSCREILEKSAADTDEISPMTVDFSIDKPPCHEVRQHELVASQTKETICEEVSIESFVSVDDQKTNTQTPFQTDHLHSMDTVAVGQQAQNSQVNSVSPFKCDTQGMFHLGQGVSIQKGQWDKLFTQKRPSLFVKDLAQAIWGRETLKERSVSGAAPRQKTAAGNGFPALSPIKREAVTSSLQHWMKIKEMSNVEAEIKNVNKYLTEKIQDTRRSEKRSKL